MGSSTLIATTYFAYDANGNTLSDSQGRSFTWDFENRLTQAVVPGANGGTTTFKYDPFQYNLPLLFLGSLHFRLSWHSRLLAEAPTLTNFRVQF
ncbi:MAG: hypothetical protein WBQ72_06980 [Terriglobales bacterium]|jgi:hypothetical protein